MKVENDLRPLRQCPTALGRSSARFDKGLRRLPVHAPEAMTVGEVLQVASNFHDPEKPTIGIWFAARLVDPHATPVAGDDAVAVAWFDPASPPRLAFPTDATLLAQLAGGS